MIKVNSREDFLKQLNKLIPKRSTCVEIGVLYGDFSKMILDITEPELLLLIDPYETNNETYSEGLNFLPTAYSTFNDYENLKKRFYNERLSGQLKIFKEYSFEIVKYLPDHVYDWVYIDASHLKKDVSKDANDWLPKLKENGIMCFHDFIEFPDFGVVEAVLNFCDEYKFEAIILNENGGDVALQKRK